jgi:hypothetical protein
MTTLALFSISVLAVVGGLVLFRIIPAVQTYFTYRGKRLITCPETLTEEAVDVAAGKAAAEVFVGGSRLRLEECSRWPERRDCGQECLQQIVADPDNCLIWNIVSNWYEGQRCVYCHKRFGPLHHLDHVPALLGPDRKRNGTNFSPSSFPSCFRPIGRSAGVAMSRRRSGANIRNGFCIANEIAEGKHIEERPSR